MFFRRFWSSDSFRKPPPPLPPHGKKLGQLNIFLSKIFSLRNSNKILNKYTFNKKLSCPEIFFPSDKGKKCNQNVFQKILNKLLFCPKYFFHKNKTSNLEIHQISAIFIHDVLQEILSNPGCLPLSVYETLPQTIYTYVASYQAYHLAGYQVSIYLAR